MLNARVRGLREGWDLHLSSSKFKQVLERVINCVLPGMKYIADGITGGISCFTAQGARSASNLPVTVLTMLFPA
jgi:hypothetical protein